MVFVAQNSLNQPSNLYALIFDNLEADSIEEVIAGIKVKTISEGRLSKENEIQEWISEEIKNFDKKLVTLENGAEAFLYYNKAATEKMPMVTMLHGGPFSAAPADMFLANRLMFLLSGFSVLNVAYRGTISYGQKQLQTLIGSIGVNDVADCGEMTKRAVEAFPDIVDEKRIGVYGGSHGGFLTSWLLGHSEYKHLFKAGVSWNPVLNMSYMVASTDIPDWMYACVLNQPNNYFLSMEDNQKFYERSPITVAKEVVSP